MMRWITLLTLVVFTVNIAAAQEDVPSLTIADVLANDPRVSEFYASLQANAQELLEPLSNSDGLWTVFVPVDGALADIENLFAQNAQGFMVDVDAEALLADSDQLGAYVRYHTVPAALSADYLTLEFHEVGTMLVGQSIRFYQSPDGIQTIGAFSPQVIEIIPASNGYIHIMDSVIVPLRYTLNGVELPVNNDQLYPPSDFDPNSERLRLADVITALRTTGQHEYLANYLQAHPNMLARLENGGYYTLFATTDAYFEDLYGDAEAVEAVLSAEVAPDQYDVASALINGGIVPGYFEFEDLARYTQFGSPANFLTWDDFNAVNIVGFTERDFTELFAYGMFTIGEPFQAINIIIYPYDGAPMIG